MYRQLRVAIVVPCYNEEKLAAKTIETIPKFVDTIVAVNDGSSDKTLGILTALAKKHRRMQIVNNPVNQGLGKSMLNAFEALQAAPIDVIGVMAGDNQMDPAQLPKLLDALIDDNVDVAKANRFMELEALSAMPQYRRIGNIFVSLLTKFATGYYQIFDSLNGYIVYRKRIIDKIPKNLIGHRYEYENTMLIALSVVGAQVRDVSIPANYGQETSTINVFGSMLRTLRVLYRGFWKRIYYKYVLYSFHPVALFLFGGIVLGLFGSCWAVFVLFEKLVQGIGPSTGTAMLVVLPIILGLQLVLTAISMDVANEEKR